MVSVHICCGKLLPQMSSENPLSVFSLRKPSQTPRRDCEACVIASPSPSCSAEKFMPVGCFAFAGCHKSCGTDGCSKGTYSLGWLAKEGNTLDRNKECFSCSAQTDLRSLWILPAVELAPIKPSVLPHGGLFSDSSAVQACSPFPHAPVPLNPQFQPDMSQKWKVKPFLRTF